MGRQSIVQSVIALFVFSLCVCWTAAAQSDFSGTWVLDKEKSGHVTSQLRSYTMVVTQTEQQLTVDTKVDRGSGPAGRGGGGGGFGGGFPGAGGAFPGGGGGGAPGGEGGPGGPGGPGRPGGQLALGMVIHNATFSLDGTETKEELKGPMPGTATLKAKWSKDRKALELTVVHRVTFRGSKSIFASQGKWKLSERGEVLTLQRAAQTPMGMDTVKLIFTKGKTLLPEESVQ